APGPREPLAPLVGERWPVEAARLPAQVQVAQCLAHRVDVVRLDHHPRPGVAHELSGGAVARDDAEDRPLGPPVPEDLPGQHTPAATARLRDQEEQHLGITLQLERAPAGDVAEQLETVAEAELLGILAIRSAEVAGETDDDIVEPGLGERAEERLRVALAL